MYKKQNASKFDAFRLLTKSAVWQSLTNTGIFFVLFFVGVLPYGRGKERKKAIKVGNSPTFSSYFEYSIFMFFILRIFFIAGRTGLSVL